MKREEVVYSDKYYFPKYVEFFNVDKIAKIIFRDNITVVFLEDGTKGMARCSEKDAYNEMIGFFMAYYRAMAMSEINQREMMLMHDFYSIIKTEPISGYDENGDDTNELVD